MAGFPTRAAQKWDVFLLSPAHCCGSGSGLGSGSVQAEEAGAQEEVRAAV